MATPWPDRQPVWTQYRSCFPAPLVATFQRRPGCMGRRESLFLRDSGGRAVRLGHPLAGQVEGLFDLATLWQAGFRNTTCAIGTHLTPLQFQQLSEQPDRPVYIVFDQDENQAGQLAAHHLALRLAGVGVPARVVQLPAGHDPNSYFVAGATAAEFSDCLERAQQL